MAPRTKLLTVPVRKIESSRSFTFSPVVSYRPISGHWCFTAQACYVCQMLTQSDIEGRLPVWHAFSELFLDTELQPEDYSRIAVALRDSKIEQAKLKSILNEEVAPVFFFNLLDVAGEWGGWSAEQVRNIMTASLPPSTVRPTPLSWLKRRMLRRYLANEWSKLEPLLNAV